MYLKRAQIEEIANRLGLSEYEVEDVEAHFFGFLKDCISSKDMPIIKIKNLGSFKPKYNKVKHGILHCIKNIRSGKFEEHNRERLKYLWSVRNNLIKNEQLKYYG